MIFTYLSLAALNERLLSFFALSQTGASIVGTSIGLMAVQLSNRGKLIYQ